MNIPNTIDAVHEAPLSIATSWIWMPSKPCDPTGTSPQLRSVTWFNRARGWALHVLTFYAAS